MPFYNNNRHLNAYAQCPFCFDGIIAFDKESSTYYCKACNQIVQISGLEKPKKDWYELIEKK